MIEYREIRHFHMACGLGGGAKGFNKASARVGNLVAKFRCIGGVDVNAAACRDFARIAGVPATCMDLFDRRQFVAFHGHEPHADWREATPVDIRRAAGGERPHIVFASYPCKGFSGLLSEKASGTEKYQALNGLTLRGMMLVLEAWKDDPVELIIFENVPRIQTRGRWLVDQIAALMRSHGYAVAETTHDCGEIGGLAQSRKRFLMVARHMAKVPNFVYEPPRHRLRGVGEVLDKLPLPLSGFGGPMHRMPALQWKTWVRLSFVEAGSDWRSLERLAVEEGILRDYGIVRDHAFGVLGWDQSSGAVAGESLPSNGRFAVADPRMHGAPHNGCQGVQCWEQSSVTVTSNGRPHSGAFSVADPRIDGHPKSVQLGVRKWSKPAGVVTGKMFAGGGPNAVADPRIDGRPRFNNVFRIIRYGEHAPAVAGPGGPAGGLAVADPRAHGIYAGKGKYGVAGFGGPANTVIGASTTGHGAFAVADPRVDTKGYASNQYGVNAWGEHAGTMTGQRAPGQGTFSVADPRPEFARGGRDRYLTAGHYGVVPYDNSSRAVTGSGQHDNGFNSVADPRLPSNQDEKINTPLPGPEERLVCVIQALDQTWHRPFTTLELAALQSLVDPEEQLELDGLSDSAWRERIGNMVPPDAAEAMGGVFGRCLLSAWTGETFSLSTEKIWVRDVAVALMAAQ